MLNLAKFTRSAALAAVVAAGTIAAAPALAGGFTTFSIGTTFGGGGHGHRYGHDGYGRGGYDRGGYGHYGRGYHGYGPRSNISLGFSTTYYGSPYYDSYYGGPYYGGSYYSGYPGGYGAYPPVIVQQPVYAAPRTDDGYYRQSAYTSPPPPAGECLQQREYQTTINIGGDRVPAYGTACLQPDGSWAQGPAQPEQ